MSTWRRTLGPVAMAILLLGSSASAQAAGRCIDQMRNMVFDMLNDGRVVQVGNPANQGWAARDPSGQMFLRLPSTAPAIKAFFVSWRGELVEIDRYTGARQIGACQFQPGDVPPPPLPVYQPPVMHPDLGVQTPQGFMPIPQELVDPSKPFAQPMVTGEGQAQSCYQDAFISGGLNRQQFGDCMVMAMAGKREGAAYQCVRSNGSPEAQAFCMIGALGGKREAEIASALQECHSIYRGDYSRYPLCMSGYVAGGDAGRVLSCVEQQSLQGQITVMGTAVCYGAQQLDLNPEMQIVVQCAAATGGNPYTFTSCAGGQLTARELDKCLAYGVGGSKGCFGENNDIVKGLREVGNALSAEFGSNNDIVRTWNNAVREVSNGQREAGRVLQNVGNEVARTPKNVVKAIERAVPRIRVKIKL